MSPLLDLSLLLLALWIAFEICHHDITRPKPKDPYRLDRWRNGEKDLDV